MKGCDNIKKINFEAILCSNQLLLKSFAYCRDIGNIIQYGSFAPKFAERIWIDPKKCKKSLHKIPGWSGRRCSGRIINSPWPHEHAELISVESKKFQCCIEHWENNVTWERSGVFEHMEETIRTSLRSEVDDCKTIDDIQNRYKRLDMLFEQVKIEKRFKTRHELSPNNFREDGGVIMHIGPNGEPFLAGGVHRYSVAYILNIPIPAQIGCIHISALQYLDKLRVKHETYERKMD